MEDSFLKNPSKIIDIEVKISAIASLTAFHVETSRQRFCF